jgi:hypothetical protein
MRIVPLLLTLLLFAASAAAGEIREFNVATLERLGRELSHRDGIAARATDLVLKEYPVARSLKMRGWITELQKSGDAVHFIAETPSGPTLAYTATFRQSGEPEVQDMRGVSLPADVAVRYKARNAAVAALQGRLFDINYNFEVLDDPDGKGFLVYALAAAQKSDEVILAGHFRVTVSADGTKAERVDALSKSLLFSGPIKSGSPTGDDTVALFLIQLVSNKPVETLIYTANLAKKPIYVRTPDGKTWIVEEGKMQVDTSKPSPQ